MNQYLHLRCGTVELLLQIDCVQEVGATGNTHGMHALRLWRQQQLPVLDIVGLLKQHAQREHQIVIEENGRLSILDVESILGMISATEQEFHPFTQVTADVARCFDKALIKPDGRCLLRLRQPLDGLIALSQNVTES